MILVALSPECLSVCLSVCLYVGILFLACPVLTLGQSRTKVNIENKICIFSALCLPAAPFEKITFFIPFKYVMEFRSY